MHFWAFRGVKIQNSPFSGNHGATSGRHWIHYKPTVLGTLWVGMYVTPTTGQGLLSLKVFLILSDQDL